MKRRSDSKLFKNSGVEFSTLCLVYAPCFLRLVDVKKNCFFHFISLVVVGESSIAKKDPNLYVKIWKSRTVLIRSVIDF